MNIYGIIMAGGGGTRFWPLSRKSSPKQLLNLSGNEVMVNETVDRLSRVVLRENIFIVTNKDQAMKVSEVTKDRILSDHILSEPYSRNTAACIGYAAAKILKEHGDGIMIVTPSDAYIKDDYKYAQVLSTAVRAAENTDSLVTVGITPTFPSTGYGYIKFSDSDEAAKRVERFVEKPDLETAQSYIADGKYLWNSGMFIWKASVILDKFKALLPDIYKDIMKISDSLGTAAESETLEKVYADIKSVSIDYGIMEQTDNISVVAGDFGWNDVGSWDMMNVLHAEDVNGNVIIGENITMDTAGSVIYSSGRMVATIGVTDLVVVETSDAVLVCPKTRVQDVKKIVEELNARKLEKLL